MDKRKRNSTILSKESYKHKLAKVVLMEWLGKKFHCEPEIKLGKGAFTFIPDVTTFTDGHIQAFYEVTHLHPADCMKLAKMQYYCYENKIDLLLHEVDAEWIMNQTKEPEYIENFTFDLSARI